MSVRPRTIPVLAAFVLAAGVAVSPAARADGDGTSMFGFTAGSAASGASGSAVTASSGAACRAQAAASGFSFSFSELESVAEELSAAAAVLAQAAPAAPPAPSRPRVAPRPAVPPVPVSAARARQRAGREAKRARIATDTTLVVRPGSRFELHSFGGQVAIATWARNAVRIQVEHPRRDWAELTQGSGLLRVSSVSPNGPAQAFEYRLTVPAWLPVALSGVYNDVTAEGLEGGIDVETVRGDIIVRRASGTIALRSVEGMVDLSDAKGTIKVSSVNDGVRLMKVNGSVRAEAVNGDIQLLDLSSRNVEATTVNGAVLYDGSMFDDGTYLFSTHNGDIALRLTERSNATVTVSTYAGEFEAPFPIRLSRTQPGKRFAFALGNGKAKVNVESFQGAIQLFKPGDRAVLERFRDSWRESELERVREGKWIWKGEWNEDDIDDVEDAHDADDADDAVPVGHKRKTK